MKLTSKLLTALLPITVASTLAPVLSSCNKGNGYVINYGDEIDCLDTTSKTYHSLDSVKSSVRSHANVETNPTIAEYQLPNWNDTTGLSKQSMYYDLVASVAILANAKFHLTWTTAESGISIKLALESGSKSGVALQYSKATDNSINIEIVDGNAVTYSTKSYNFQNTKIGE